MGMAADGGPGGGLSARARRTFVALGYREYLLFWAGAAFSNLGIWALFAGRLWLMHELTTPMASTPRPTRPSPRAWGSGSRRSAVETLPSQRPSGAPAAVRQHRSC